MRNLVGVMLLGMSLLFIRCQDLRNSEAEAMAVKLEHVKADIQYLQQGIDSLEMLLDQKPPLVHLVFLTLKPNADQLAVRKELYKLQGIEEVAHFELGQFEDLKDDRALSSYQVIMHTEFASQEDYDVYAKHPTHLAVKARLKSMLAGPPAVYDYMRTTACHVPDHREGMEA